MLSTSNLKSRQSFENLSHWLKEARDNVLDECIFVLIGSKNDLERTVSYDEGINFMNEKGLDIFFETSALKNSNVTEMFERTTRELLDKSLKIRTLKDREAQYVDLERKTKRKEKKGCC